MDELLKLQCIPASIWMSLRSVRWEVSWSA